MAQSIIRFGLLFLSALMLAACSGGVSKYARSQVTYFEPFDQLQQQPDKYLGVTVIWGGRVISSVARQGATEIEVLQLDLNNRQRPVNNDRSKGRFIIRSDGFIDPVLYPKGTMVTVVGPFNHMRERAIDQMPYRYPVIGITEIKKWPPTPSTSPRFHFGIGIGTHF